MQPINPSRGATGVHLFFYVHKAAVYGAQLQPVPVSQFLIKSRTHCLLCNTSNIISHHTGDNIPHPLATNFQAVFFSSITGRVHPPSDVYMANSTRADEGRNGCSLPAIKMKARTVSGRGGGEPATCMTSDLSYDYCSIGDHSE